MRIIGGEFKGRRLKSPPKGHVRPIQDKVKAAIFNMLGHQITGAKVLDLFAGSGSFGIEALSRGADHVTFVDSDPQLVQLLKRNLALLGVQERASVFHEDALGIIEELGQVEQMFDLIFSDPPYGGGLAKSSLLKVAECVILTQSGWLITELHKKEEVPERAADVVLMKRRLYGSTAVCFYRR